MKNLKWLTNSPEKDIVSGSKTKICTIMQIARRYQNEEEINTYDQPRVSKLV